MLKKGTTPMARTLKWVTFAIDVLKLLLRVLLRGLAEDDTPGGRPNGPTTISREEEGQCE